MKNRKNFGALRCKRILSKTIALGPKFIQFDQRTKNIVFISQSLYKFLFVLTFFSIISNHLILV
jgi:hypothetical protein